MAETTLLQLLRLHQDDDGLDDVIEEVDFSHHQTHPHRHHLDPYWSSDFDAIG